MQLRFQATPVNLNAQVDRNNNKLHKFKIDRTCSGACLFTERVSISLGLGPDLHKFLPRLASLAPSFMTKFIDNVLATIST